MILKAVVEVHRLLGACQVLLICDENFSSGMSSLQVSIVSDSVTLISNEKVLSCVKFGEIKLKSQSISGMAVSENNICFRVQIESENNLKLNENKGVRYVPKIEKDKDIDLLCRCCENIICKNLNFKRILPLPSVDDWNYDDWFCHKHSNCENSKVNEISETDRNKLKNVSPTDCLYDHYYIQINTNFLLSKKLGVIHCDKCLSWIGKKTENYVRLWNSSLKLGNDESLKISSLTDFINVVLNKINDSVSPVFKLIALSHFTNNSEHYLVMRVMDKNLTVLTNRNANVNVDIDLSEIKVVKILYSYYNTKNEIVQSWLDDPLIEIVEVSKPMLLAGSESLINSTKMIAKPYRCIGSMNLGYLQLI